MKLKELFLHKLKTIILFTLFFTVTSGIIMHFLSNGFIYGIIYGFFMTLSLAIIEMLFFENNAAKKLPFTIHILSKTFLYVIDIIIIFVLVHFILEGFDNILNELNYLILSFVFCFVFTIIANVSTMINKLLGNYQFLNIVLGKYYKPKEENRIFMFIDLNDSTSIAEKIGHIKFHSLINDFFIDICEPILSAKGEIYKYVGDEVIISWKIKKFDKKTSPINCFFDILDIISYRQKNYLKEYGIIPQFKASLHSGPVTVGETGFIKKEISYLGDTVNTTSRILSLCKEDNFIISENITKIIPLDENLLIREIGNIKLRGKENEILLYSISRKISKNTV